MKKLKNKIPTNIFIAFNLIFIFYNTCFSFSSKEYIQIRTKIGNSSQNKNRFSDSTQISETENINFKLRPKFGNKFQYLMSISTIESEGENKNTISQINDKKINYYYTEEVVHDNDNFITYKITFDSILITSKIIGKDYNKKEIYNSQIKDSTYNLSDYYQYNSVMGEYFFINVNTLGEIDSLYGLNKIYAKLFDYFGDSLSEVNKNAIKNSFSSDGLIPILQNQFQIFPSYFLKTNFTWNKLYESEVESLALNNNIEYRVLKIFKEKNDTIVTISANLLSKFIKDIDAMKKIQKYDISGNAIIKINLTKSTLIEKETNSNYNFIFYSSFKSFPIKKIKVHLKIVLLQ